MSPVMLRCKAYADGKPRPSLRGVLHGGVSLALAASLLAYLVELAAGAAAPTRGWRIVGLILGKLASYAASGTLHLVSFRSVGALTRALEVDLVLVSCSIWASSSLFAPSASEWLAVFATGLLFTLVNCALVLHQFRGHVGLKTPPDRSDVPRSVLLVLQFVSTVGYIGWRYGYRDLWFISTGIYIVSFAVSTPVTAAHEEEPMSEFLPWHRLGRNGFHEDFHILVLVADAIVVIMGLRFLSV